MARQVITIPSAGFRSTRDLTTRPPSNFYTWSPTGFVSIFSSLAEEEADFVAITAYDEPDARIRLSLIARRGSTSEDLSNLWENQGGMTLTILSTGESISLLASQRQRVAPSGYQWRNSANAGVDAFVAAAARLNRSSASRSLQVILEDRISPFGLFTRGVRGVNDISFGDRRVVRIDWGDTNFWTEGDG